jgi:hypothetical protein
MSWGGYADVGSQQIRALAGRARYALSWIWGIGNNTFIAFLTFVPFVGIVMPFVAWRAIAGLITIAGLIVLSAAMLTAIFASLKGSEAYQMQHRGQGAGRRSESFLQRGRAEWRRHGVREGDESARPVAARWRRAGRIEERAAHRSRGLKMKKLLFVAIALAAAYFGAVEIGLVPGKQPASTSASSADQALAAAFENQQSNIQVQGGGQVSRVLPDDNDGSRHQRFLVRLASGQTLLGWRRSLTHRDPEHRHVDGWIKHNGKTYQ